MRQILESIGLEVLGYKYYSKSWSLAFLHDLILKLYPRYKLARFLSGLLKPIIRNKWVGRIRVLMPTQNNFMIVANVLFLETPEFKIAFHVATLGHTFRAAFYARLF